MVDLDVPPIRLTELTDCGGCAAKLGADALSEALAGLGIDDDVERPAVEGSIGLLAGLDPPDDAAVHLVAPGVAVIGTVDFFPPIVDDPRTYGEIAAANALSDVFAMGGRVLFALSVAAIPESMATPVFRAILDGAASKVREAGGILAGGHTIRDPEPKYGLAVIGVASPDRLLRKGGAKPGDVLLLTKPLGTGLLVSGRRQGRTSDADLAAAADSMRALNRRASEVLVEHGVTAATDVTGFGLLGHGLEMARASRTRFEFDAAALPALDGALELARAGVETGGAAHNRRFVADSLIVAGGVPPELVTLAHDPQTSGGLLASIDPSMLDAVEAALAEAGVPRWRVGRVEQSGRGAVALRGITPDGRLVSASGGASISRVLVTGISGTGKSSALAELRRRGYRTVDTDEPGWREYHPYPVPIDELHRGEYHWVEQRMIDLLESDDGRSLFVAGGVRNQSKFYDRFDAVVLLSAPAEILFRRIADRTANSYGKTALERSEIAADLAEIEPLLRTACTHELDASRPLESVVTDLIAIAANPRRRRRGPSPAISVARRGG